MMPDFIPEDDLLPNPRGCAVMVLILALAVIMAGVCAILIGGGL